jgi:4-carboxymuconolactone decarboxylase
VNALDSERSTLVRLAAIIAVGTEPELRVALSSAALEVRTLWVEELILQSYLFAGFPRALNAAREWRRISGTTAPGDDEGERIDEVALWQERGADTCATVYGRFYDGLRRNIRLLHPALDSWMIVEGYGKVLSRPGMELRLRELCIVAVCAAARQDRQLHSHLFGALNAGASPAEVSETLESVADLLPPDDLQRYRQLWVRVQGSSDVH